MEDFVNLRVHSSYSIKDGLMDYKKIVDIAAKNGEKAVAITDLNYMLKAVDFYEYARKKGVKPIIGLDAYIERDITNQEDLSLDNLDGFEPTRILLLAKNEEGYINLNKLLSRAHTENQKEELKGYEGVGFIKQSWLNKESTKNIIALSGDITSGDVIREYMYGDKEKAIEKANLYKEAFSGEYYLEIQRYGQKDEYESILNTARISYKTNIPIVATHPVQFEKRTDFYNHEVRSCIVSKEEVSDINRETKFTREQYYKNNEEINEMFKDLPEAIRASSIIADKCNVKLRLHVNDLPQYPTGDKSTEDFLRYTAHEGLIKRMEENFPDEKERSSVMKKYEDRLNWELDTINNMGFPGYFLIVYDFIDWAKKNDIFVGPGRGSGAGSLVAYSLGITDLDPLPYNLLFERFLNPERVSMPDFDIDFESIRRPEVIQYVHRTYDGQSGALSVSQIATYGLLKAKSVIKAAARTLQIPYVVSDQISKKIPNDPKLKLQDVLDQDWMKEDMTHNEQIAKLMETCRALENIPTSIGVHAGGVVIGKTELTNYTPLSRADMNSTIFSQYDKDEVEKAGLVKFDFLALSNLTVLQKAIQSINLREEFKTKPFDLKKIDLKDKKVFELFKAGNSVAVFQFEGQGMQNTLKLIGPDRFEDLIAIVSLFRPGPMELIPDYAERKKGAEFDYPHEALSEVLGETYGIMIYQEQVMQVAQKIAGYSLGQADMLRRAMGKKKAEEMAKQREVFREGALKNGVSAEKADEIFDLMEKFASYGFNKSHAAAYALISYQTAYLKTHYTPEYFTAFLNVEAMEKASKNSEKVEILLNDARLNGLEILPPDINKCSSEFTFEGNQVRYGLSGIKGVSPASIDTIKENLDANGEFKSFADFYQRIGVKSKKSVIENLIFAGVFDNLEPNRARLINSMIDFLEYKKQLKKYEDNIVKNEERVVFNENIDQFNADIEKFNEKIEKLSPETTNFERAALVEEMKIYNPKFKEGEELVKVKAAKPKKMLKLPELILPELSKDESQWTSITKYNYEKAVYGFYLTGHPYNYYHRELNGFEASCPLEEIPLLDPPSEGENHLISGVIHTIEKKKTKNGDPMWIMTMGDGKELTTLFAFNFTIDKFEEKLKVGEFVSFQVKISPPKGNMKKNMVSIEDVLTYGEVKEKLIKGVNIALLSSENADLIEIIKKHPGNMKVTIYNPENDMKNFVKADLDVKDYGISGAPDCISELTKRFGENKVKLRFHNKMLFSNSYKYKVRM